MMKRSIVLPIIICICWITALAQVPYTANDNIQPYTSAYSYGSNMGFYAPWVDEQLADIAAGNDSKAVLGVGVTSLRPSLPAHFLEQWGYDIRVMTFDYYKRLGVRDNVVFIGYPGYNQKETTQFCPGVQSEVFANMYEPIWDGGANGTPVNENNYYALYLYEMVKRYKPYVKIWEISNEPDFDRSGNSERKPGEPGNWWENNPSPCDIALYAPIQYYVRMLRISYEVIKSMDPDAYIATGGVGYPSFIDAVLRNTDNPAGGSKTSKYPFGGGAYFDVMSFHSYPHIDGSLRTWSNSIMNFVYKRNSDEAVKGLIARKDEFERVLHKYNYNGHTYPEKIFIVTETCIPRKEFGEYIGSNQAQRNFVVKASIEAQKAGIKQTHIYSLGEAKPFNGAGNEFELMGFYEDLPQTQPYAQTVTPMGKAYKTMSDMLDGLDYDPVQTQSLLLTNTVRGAAFSDGQRTVFALWAKTLDDRSEAAAAQYTFPALMNVETLTVYPWDYAYKKEHLDLQGSTIQLTGDPVFIIVNDGQGGTPSSSNRNGLSYQFKPNPFLDSLNISFQLEKESNVSLRVYDAKGQPISTIFDRVVLPPGLYQQKIQIGTSAGVYFAKLTVGNQEYSERILKMEAQQ